MQRRTLMKLTAAALAAPALVRAQTTKRAIVIGAGAAGLTAAYVLRQAGVDVQVLEAAPRWGGRIQRLDGFADFPIDLGAEWIHTDPEVLDEIAGKRVETQVETITYQPQTYQLWHGGKLRNRNALRHGYAEVKFYRTTWYGFFEKFIWPSVADIVALNRPVTSINYVNNDVRVTAGGRAYDADRVIVTVPVSALHERAIHFSPGLPTSRLRGFDGLNFGSGFKLFMRFKERFYPDLLLTQSLSQAMADTWDDKTYYDAAFRKEADAHVLGLFSTREYAYERAGMSHNALLRDVMGELDEIYDGAPSKLLVKTHSRRWSQDQFIRGTYSMEYDYEEYDSLAEVFAPLDNKVFFAGEAMGGEDQSTVHGAALSGRAVAEAML